MKLDLRRILDLHLKSVKQARKCLTNDQEKAKKNSEEYYRFKYKNLDKYIITMFKEI